jgi:hypothetical protein
MTLCAACCVSSHVASGAANGRSKPLKAAWRACGSWWTEVRLGPEQKSSVEGKTTGVPVRVVIGEIKFNQFANRPGACAELSEKIKWPAAQQVMVFEVNRCQSRRLVNICQLQKL